MPPVARRHPARQALRRMASHARRFANPQNSFFHSCQRYLYKYFSMIQCTKIRSASAGSYY